MQEYPIRVVEDLGDRGARFYYGRDSHPDILEALSQSGIHIQRLYSDGNPVSINGHLRVECPVETDTGLVHLIIHFSRVRNGMSIEVQNGLPQNHAKFLETVGILSGLSKPKH